MEGVLLVVEDEVDISVAWASFKVVCSEQLFEACPDQAAGQE